MIKIGATVLGPGSEGQTHTTAIWVIILGHQLGSLLCPQHIWHPKLVLFDDEGSREFFFAGVSGRQAIPRPPTKAAPSPTRTAAPATATVTDHTPAAGGPSANKPTPGGEVQLPSGGGPNSGNPKQGEGGGGVGGRRAHGSAVGTPSDLPEKRCRETAFQRGGDTFAGLVRGVVDAPPQPGKWGCSEFFHHGIVQRKF